MFFDFDSQINRLGWKYTYQGSQLLFAAKTKLRHYQEEERQRRQDLAELLNSAAPLSHSTKPEELRKQIEFAARQVEALQVFAYEFERVPQKEYHLSLGDVVYFGLLSTDAGNDSV